VARAEFHHPRHYRGRTFIAIKCFHEVTDMWSPCASSCASFSKIGVPKSHESDLQLHESLYGYPTLFALLTGHWDICTRFCKCHPILCLYFCQKLLGVVRCRFRRKRPCVCLHLTSSHAPPLEESTNYREDTSDDTPGLLINADTSEEPLLYHSTSGSSHPYTCTCNSTTRSWPNGTVN